MRAVLFVFSAFVLTACFGGGSNPSRSVPSGMGEVCGIPGLIGTEIGTVYSQYAVLEQSSNVFVVACSAGSSVNVHGLWKTVQHMPLPCFAVQSF